MTNTKKRVVQAFGSVFAFAFAWFLWNWIDYGNELGYTNSIEFSNSVFWFLTAAAAFVVSLIYTD